MIETAAIALLLLAGVGVWLYHSRSGRRRVRTIRFGERVTVVDGVLRCSSAAGKESLHAVDDLLRIDMVTTSQGPFVDDLFMRFEFVDQALVLPSEHPDWRGVYDALSELLPLDHRKSIDASCSTEDAEFPIWSKTDT